MKKITMLICVLTSAICLNAQELKVLFVGNSYTSANNLPEILTNLAQDKSQKISYKCFTDGASRFMKHWENPQLTEEIKSGRYDILVLQGQSQEVAFPYNQFMDEVYPYAYKLDSLFKEYNPQSRVIYFMTWGYRYGDQMNCPFYPPFCTYETMSQELCQNYSLMASDFQSELAPVGRAWLYLFNLDSTAFNLHSADNSHPNMQGSYFSACVLYTTMFNSPVTSSFYGGLQDTEAQNLQQTANDLFSNYNFTDCDFVSSLPITPTNTLTAQYNPTLQTLEITALQNEDIITAEIYNLNGIKVKETVGRNTRTLSLDIKNLLTGYYIAKIYTNNQKNTYRFIKK